MGIRDNAKAEYQYQYLHAEKEEIVPPAPPFNEDLAE
jgi:hypothetical protein